MSDSSGVKQDQPCLVRGLGRNAHPGFTVGCGKEEELGRGVGMGEGAAWSVERGRYLGSMFARHPWHAPFSLK